MNYLHNQVQLTGRVATDPEIYFTSDGTPKARLTLLQDSPRKTGENRPARFTVIGWEGLARQLHEVVRANDRLFVQGKLRNRSFVSAGVTHVRTEIHLDHYVLLKSPRSSHRLRKARNRTTGTTKITE